MSEYVNEPDPHPPESHDEEGGGPIKSFLDHLEDLRWTIIRSVSAILIGMVVCLVAANYIITWLKHPLEAAERIRRDQGGPTVFVALGNTKLASFKLETNRFPGIDFGSNQTTVARLGFTQLPSGTSTNRLLTVEVTGEKPPRDWTEITIMSTGPMSPFMVVMQIALYGGIGLASPFVLFFVGQFVVPALRRTEKVFTYRALAFGVMLFVGGVLFCYHLVLPITLEFSTQFAEWAGFKSDLWRAEEYLGFICKFMIGMGISFELPIVILSLVKVGLIDYRSLNKFRGYFVIVAFVLAAMLTPDASMVSQVLMAAPLIVLYELSVLVAWIWHRQDRRRNLEVSVQD